MSAPRRLSDEATVWILTAATLAAAVAVLVGTFLPSLVR